MVYDDAMLRLIDVLARHRLWADERGQDMVEYALMAGFITVAVAATFPPASGSISTIFSKLNSLLTQSVA
jgi:Flp pilus assembly pilin Flp